MISVLFVLPNLAGGGAERAVIELLRGLDRELYRPTLALFERTGPYLDAVPSDVPIHLFDGFHLLKRRRLRRLTKQLKEIVVATGARIVVPSTILSVTALFRAGFLWPGMPPLVPMHQDNLTQETAHRARGWKRRLLLAELKLLFTRPTKVACVSAGVRSNLTSRFYVPTRKCVVIPNGLDLDAIRRLAAEPVEERWFPSIDQPTIVTVGRLVTQKAHGDLLEAFQIVRSRMLAKLVIIGIGPLETKLREHAALLGLRDDVVFGGFQKNPWKFMARADLFVLSSHHEGLGNVLVEAMAAGAPVLSTNCDYGPAEIIRDGETGALVPVAQPPTLGQRMVNLLEDVSTRRRYAASAAADLDFYGARRMVEQFQTLFVQVDAARRV